MYLFPSGKHNYLQSYDSMICRLLVFWKLKSGKMEKTKQKKNKITKERQKKARSKSFTCSHQAAHKHEPTPSWRVQLLYTLTTFPQDGSNAAAILSPWPGILAKYTQTSIWQWLGWMTMLTRIPLIIWVTDLESWDACQWKIAYHFFRYCLQIQRHRIWIQPSAKILTLYWIL